MAGSNCTFEAWMKNEILIIGQQSKFSNTQLFPNIPSFHPKEIPKYQLTKIRKEQKRIGRKIINGFIKKQKKKFYSTFKKSAAKIPYKQSVIEEIECLFNQPIEKGVIKFIISSLELEIPGKVLRGVFDFYKDHYELGKKMNYEFVSPEHPQQKSNGNSSQLLTIALFELNEWVKNFEEKRLDVVTKAAKKDNFKVALSFAKGDVYKWYEQNKSFMKCAEKLNIPNARPWISETFRNDPTSNKNIFNHPNLIREVIDHCYFHSIKIDDRFTARCIRAKINVD